jgi:hypothetical protein
MLTEVNNYIFEKCIKVLHLVKLHATTLKIDISLYQCWAVLLGIANSLPTNDRINHKVYNLWIPFFGTLAPWDQPDK